MDLLRRMWERTYQALEADVAVFVVGIDQFGVMAALEQGAQPSPYSADGSGGSSCA